MTTATNKAIQKAVDNGYKYRGDKPLFDDRYDLWYCSDKDGGYFYPGVEIFFLDPKFWKCLAGEDWQEMWRLFVEYLIKGKSIEYFFKKLKL